MVLLLNKQQQQSQDGQWSRKDICARSDTCYKVFALTVGDLSSNPPNVFKRTTTGVETAARKRA
jgi:hypothetical protein